MKTCKFRLMATAAALALAAPPAFAQQSGDASSGEMRPMQPNETMTETIDPGSGAVIRIITRQVAPEAQEGTEAADPAVSGPDAGGSGTAGDAGGDGQTRAARDVDAAIEQADGATTGVTDPAGGRAATADADTLGFEFSEGDGNDDGGSALPGGVDMDAFARELFEQGYRQGYVAALTEMRMRAGREMRRNRARADQEAQRRRAAQAERERASRVQILEDGDGNTVVVLPPGMTPQMFLRGMQRSMN